MRQSVKIFGVFIMIAAMFGSFAGCGGQALFDELSTSRLKVIVKGTYESNDARPWDVFTDDGSVTFSPGEDANPTQFMIDIAELKLNGKSFANYRVTYRTGIDDADPFFIGAGIRYENDDVTPGKSYDRVSMYIRKLIFDNAKEYDASHEFIKDMQTYFHEEIVNGYDFNQDRVEPYPMYPLTISIPGGFRYDNTEDETILEIRVVVKNYVKKYEKSYNTTNFVHYYKMPAARAVARTYVPGKTVTLSGTGATASRYVVAIYQGEAIGDYVSGITIPPFATWTTGSNYSFTNVPVGKTYVIYQSNVLTDGIPSGFDGTPLGTFEVAEDGTITAL